jgi:hypothetical protein
MSGNWTRSFPTPALPCNMLYYITDTGTVHPMSMFFVGMDTLYKVLSDALRPTDNQHFGQ